MTYYIKVFSGNATKASVFDVLGWWLYSICFPFTEPGLCMNTGLFFSTHTERTASRSWGDILWIWTSQHSWIICGLEKKKNQRSMRLWYEQKSIVEQICFKGKHKRVKSQSQSAACEQVHLWWICMTPEGSEVKHSPPLYSCRGCKSIFIVMAHGFLHFIVPFCCFNYNQSLCIILKSVPSRCYWSCS